MEKGTPRALRVQAVEMSQTGGFESTKSVTLHHFSDASEKGYGTVSYLRMMNQQDKVKCTFLLSKSRVAPLKQISIPRMELTAATVAVRIDIMIKQELDIPIDETYFWTDSHISTQVYPK